MNTAILREYTRERKPQFHLTSHGKPFLVQGTAQCILRNAKVRAEWRQYDWDEHSEPELSDVRLRIVPDDCVSFDDLEGDTFNPKVNDDIPRSRLEREQKEFRAKVNHEGVWGVIGEYWNGDKWEHVDSCFGFVGEDWKDSGYDIDIMRATLDAMKAKLADVLQ